MLWTVYQVALTVKVEMKLQRPGTLCNFWPHFNIFMQMVSKMDYSKLILVTVIDLNNMAKQFAMGECNTVLSASTWYSTHPLFFGQHALTHLPDDKILDQSKLQMTF